jgi:uncharacterized YigZ family protein
MANDYRIPVGTHRTEIVVVNSRFITTISRVSSTEDVKTAQRAIRSEMPDANHHVYAFRVGYGNSVIEGMSDDGEPSGTAGPPVLAVLRGADIGDTLVVVTRYFGGTKLGTGGLVRAYSDAAREGLTTLPTELKIERRLVGVETPYTWYELIKRLVGEHEGVIQGEDFAGDVTLMAVFPLERVPGFTAAVIETTAGRVQPVVLDTL